MVHAIRHPAGRHSWHPHPDALRIAGITGAIAFNAALLMLLLVPISAPPPTTVEEVPYHWVLPAEKQPIPKPPVQVPVVRKQATTSPTSTPPVIQQPPTTEQVIADQGTLPAIEMPTQANDAVASIEPAAGPLPGVRLEYADAPAPNYPRDALRDGIEGTVMLQVLVDVDGRPLDVQVQHSSGNRQLDNAARKQVLERWRFRPAMKDGRAVQAIGLVPIAFNLQ